MNKKEKIALLSIGSNTFLIILKLIVGITSGSVSIISEAIHSGLDLLASIITFLSVKKSKKPADALFQYGYGKYENISGVIESLLIFFAIIWIIYEAIEKIYHPGNIESIGLGFFIMILASGVNYIVSKKLYKIAKETNSVALEADALHLKTDVYSSMGVGLGLLIIWITNIQRLDPVIAILIALLITKESFSMFKKSFYPLIDISIENGHKESIQNIIIGFDEVKEFHNFRTRQSGPTYFIEFDIVFNDKNILLKDAHDIGGIIKFKIKEIIPEAKIMIHFEV